MELDVELASGQCQLWPGCQPEASPRAEQPGAAFELCLKRAVRWPPT